MRLFGIALIGLIAAAVIAGLLPRGAQTSVIANFLLTLLILCPAALCLFPVYLIMVAVVVNVGRLERGTVKAFARVNTVSTKTLHGTQRAAERWATRSIRFNVFFAPLDKALFSIFDRPTGAPRPDSVSTKDEAADDPAQ
jgi:hypothetical protein